MNKRTRIMTCIVLVAFAIFMTVLSPVLSARASAPAPVAQNLELCTYRNVSVGGTLTAKSTDLSPLTFEITTEPTKGSVELEKDGSFVYTPDKNKRGRDYFGFKATNAQGVSSQEATVIIRITKQKTDVTYRDMNSSPDEFFAVAMSEYGIYTGAKLGDAWVFGPDDTVTRGEFMAMCMTAADSKLLSGVVSTGFLDDEWIPAWQKPYVATALMEGDISGYSVTGGAEFQGGNSITHSEAAVMINAIFGLTDAALSITDEAAPVWALRALSNVTACGLLPDGCVYEAALTRAEAARMLVTAMDIASAK